jgi:hypothetical protein
MQNDQIRKTVLEYYYQFYHEKPTSWVSCDSIANKLVISPVLLRANVMYLISAHLLEGNTSNKFAERAYLKITNYGIDAIEYPKKYSTQIPFLQVFYGDISNSVIIQGRDIHIEKSFTEIFNKMDEYEVDQKIKDAVHELKQEVEMEDPNISKIRQILQRIKVDERIFAIIAPILTKIIEKIILA